MPPEKTPRTASCCPRRCGCCSGRIPGDVLIFESDGPVVEEAVAGDGQEPGDSITDHAGFLSIPGDGFLHHWTVTLEDNYITRDTP